MSAEQTPATRLTPEQRDEDRWCRLTGPGRGDCEHFIGLPDGYQTDEYGIPLGWCDYCWLKHQQDALEAENAALREALTACVTALDATITHEAACRGLADRRCRCGYTLLGGEPG